MRRVSLAALILTALALRVCGVQAQGSPVGTCHVSATGQAVTGSVVDAATGAPMVQVRAYLTSPRPDTTFSAGGISVNSTFVRSTELDSLGRFCFETLPPGDYRFETRAMRIDESRQAILLRLERGDSLRTITLQYRPYGPSPEQEKGRLTVLSELDGNRRRWEESRPAHYLLRVKRDCAFCFERPPSTYDVVDGVPIAAIDSGQRRALRGGEQGVTIEAIFDALRASIVDESGYVEGIEYDDRLWWPRRYGTGSRSLLTDMWAKLTVERFEVIP
jgi:hypothetical protein